MVEFGNTWDSNEDFDDILRILDFPMESLEGGDELVDDWDIGNLQFLGPIPSNLITGSSTIPNDNINIWPQNSIRIDEATGQQQLSKAANAQDSGAFKTQSPVSVLESSGSCLGGKGLSVKSNGAIPVRRRSRRVRHVGVSPWLSMDFMKDSCVPDPAHLKNASSHHSVVIKKCLHCQTTKTPQWREGPMGSKTLCNACGVRYRSGRLFPEYRPAKSPTFAPLKHSNSHKKVIEMRNKQPEGIIKITEATEQKLLSNGVAVSTSHICRQNKSASIQKTQSPVSHVGSAGVKASLVASKTLNTTSKETLQMAKDPKPSKFVKTQRPLPVLESRGSILAGESSPIEHDNTIAVQSRKRVRPTRFNQSPELSTSQKTLNTKRSKKKKPFQHPIKVENSADWQNASSHRSSVNRKCAHCASTKTPQWREGPMGLLLCNACGVRYRKGCLFPEYRPADSPTFVPSKHSNSHKKVIEMRNKAKQMEGKTKVTPMSRQQEAKTAEPALSPQPEFVPMSSFFFDFVN